MVDVLWFPLIHHRRVAGFLVDRGNIMFASLFDGRFIGEINLIDGRGQVVAVLSDLAILIIPTLINRRNIVVASAFRFSNVIREDRSRTKPIKAVPANAFKIVCFIFLVLLVYRLPVGFPA